MNRNDVLCVVHEISSHGFRTAFRRTALRLPKQRRQSPTQSPHAVQYYSTRTMLYSYVVQSTRQCLVEHVSFEKP